MNAVDDRTSTSTVPHTYLVWGNYLAEFLGCRDFLKFQGTFGNILPKQIDVLAVPFGICFGNCRVPKRITKVVEAT